MSLCRGVRGVWQKFVDFLKQRKGILDAVVFSGGEPLVQDGLIEAIDEVKALGYQIGMHTGGYRPDRFREVLKHVDWVGFDIKAPFDKEKYKTVTGGWGDVDKVLESLNELIASGISFECRTTCDPRFLTVQDLYEIADSLKNMGVKEYYLQKYRPVASDTATTDSACDSFFEYPPLLEKLRSQFKTFDTRR